MQNVEPHAPADPSRSGLVSRVQRWLDRHRSESVYFYALHKCATTLFKQHVLDHIGGRRRVDYAAQINNNTFEGRVAFRRYGHLYGAIYVVGTQGIPVYDRFTGIVTDPGFVRDKTTAFLIRDPRDILISQYFSFGFTHSYAPNTSVRRRQEESRASIKDKAVDDYVMEAAPELRARFDIVRNLVGHSRRSAVLRYEDLICDFDRFVHVLEDIFRFKLDADTKRELYERSRPRATEDRSAHKRSGRVGQYRELLKPQTLETVNAIFAATLARFGYDQPESGEGPARARPDHAAARSMSPA